MLALEVCNALLQPHFTCGVHPLNPKNATKNGYVTYQDISTVGENSVKGWLGIDQVRVQINVYNHSKFDAVRNANFIKRLFTKQNLHCSCTLIGERSSHDKDTQLHAQHIDFYMNQSDNNC